MFPKIRDVPERILDFDEIEIPLSDCEAIAEASRCMQCSTPYCHAACPTNDLVPDWIEDLSNNKIHDAYYKLEQTNNFPEVTGRICDAPCQYACVLELHDNTLNIRLLEKYVADTAWKSGWVKPRIPRRKNGMSIAVVGSGPAGLSCGQQLARLGFKVDVFERRRKIGGMLRLIPEFRLPSEIVDRRVAQLKAEGVSFFVNTNVGIDISLRSLLQKYPAVILAIGCEYPRDLPFPGRELQGIMLVSELLEETAQLCHDCSRLACGKDKLDGAAVTVISNKTAGWIGVLKRRGARSVTVQNILPKPPTRANKGLTWPHFPNILDCSPYYDEGVERQWGVALKKFVGNEKGKLCGVQCVRVDWAKDREGRWQMSEIEGSWFNRECDVAIISLGYLYPNHWHLMDDVGISIDSRGNIAAPTVGDSAYRTNVDGLFAVGDARRGQSLVVWAIKEGRACAEAVREYLGCKA